MFWNTTPACIEMWLITHETCHNSHLDVLYSAEQWTLMEQWYLRSIQRVVLVHALSRDVSLRDNGASRKLGVHTQWPQFGEQRIVRSWSRHRIRKVCRTFEWISFRCVIDLFRDVTTFRYNIECYNHGKFGWFHMWLITSSYTVHHHHT